MKKLNEKELLEINGGGPIDFVIDYIAGKGLDWCWAHKAEIWEDFKNGVGENDPMRQTDFYKLFGN